MAHAAAGAVRPRVLFAVLVYNGAEFVPAALQSYARLLDSERTDVRVVVLDDASPDPGWSDQLALLCAELGLVHYRSPRNLGIPRNMNLGLLHAEQDGFDYVVIANSDVLVAANLADALTDTAAAATAAGHRVASVTAWSNNASIYSLPNDDAAAHLIDQGVLDHTAEVLAATFGASEVELPTGVGHMLCIPADAITEVGLFDPVFGRGYCEEVDWCRRAVALGRTHLLATNTFVYHIGSATNRLAGLLAPGEQTVHTNELIIDDRHPGYRDDVERWSAAGGVEEPVRVATAALVRDAARTHGWVVEASWLRGRVVARGDEGRPTVDRRVRILVQPDGGAPLVEAVSGGWRHALDVGRVGILASVADFLGVAADEVRIDDAGTVSAALRAEAAALGIPVAQAGRYPARV